MDIRRGWNGWSHRRRIAVYMLALHVVLAVYTAGYVAVIAIFEGQTVSPSAALLVVVESFTTTGYGEASDLWTEPATRLFLVLMQVTGVSMIFLALPVFVAPYIEDRLSTAPPDAVEGVSDHVVVAGYTSRGEALIDELEARNHGYVVVEPDRDRATALYEDGLSVIHGDPGEQETLTAAALEEARALVVDVDDETNAAVALTASDVGDAKVVTFAEDPEVAPYHGYAGADEVFHPQELIAGSLAGKVTAGVTPELDGAIEIGDDFDVVELPVQAGSELEGVTVAESGIRERTGTNVIGAWLRGEFVSPPSPDTRIDAQTILVIAGRENQLEQLKALTLSERRRSGEGHVIVGGYGAVGRAITDDLADAAVETVVVDVRDVPGVDVVGDVRQEETLRAAGIDEASSLILAVADDTSEVFATLVGRELNPTVEIIARADATGSVVKLYQAGADYVLAVATVAGRMLASTVLNEEVISYDQQLEIIRLDVGDLAGSTLGGADVRAETGCTVVAVERDGESVTDLHPDFRLERGDQLVVVGADEDVSRFTSLTT